MQLTFSAFLLPCHLLKPGRFFSISKARASLVQLIQAFLMQRHHLLTQRRIAFSRQVGEFAASLAAGAVATATDETVIPLHPPLPPAGVPIRMERDCQQNDSTLADGQVVASICSPFYLASVGVMVSAANAFTAIYCISPPFAVVLLLRHCRSTLFTTARPQSIW